MNPRENMMAIYNREQPDHYTDFFDAVVLVPDPILMRDKVPQDGRVHKDGWGTACIFSLDSPAKIPCITEENAVVKDIVRWREQLVVPPVRGLDWTHAEEVAGSVDRKENFVGFLCAAGLFERSHFLMGMENAFVAYMEEPEAMAQMLRAIADYKIESIKETARHIHPDVIWFHDDWGSKQNLFLPIDVWRELIKPLHTEIVQVAHDCGMMFLHHADCICEPIVDDMIDMGIDMWQGVIPQNDIVGIQERTKGKLAMLGGIDTARLDIADVTEDEIRAEVRRAYDAYLPAGRFYPCLPGGRCFRDWNNSIVLDEMDKYGRLWAQEHPIGPEGRPIM